jgi:outer membrane protein TolC
MPMQNEVFGLTRIKALFKLYSESMAYTMRYLLTSSIQSILVMAFIFLTGHPVAHAETLEDAWNIALSYDHQLQASRLNTEASRLNLSAAESARFPILSLETGYTILNNAPAAVLDEPMAVLDRIPTAEDKSLSYKTIVSLPLFTSGRISRGIDAATATLKTAMQDEMKTVLDLKLQVAEAYTSVLRAQRLVRVAETNVSSLASYSNDVKNFFDQGVVTKNDLLAAQVSLADARQRLTQASNTLNIAVASYNRLMGRPLDQQSDLADLSMEPSETDFENLQTTALEKRPELMSLSEQTRTLQHRASGIRSSTMPQVSLSGGYSYNQNKYQVYEDVWSATIGLRWDIFDGGTSRHTANALLQRAEALNEIRKDTASLISLQVRQACLDVDETGKRIEVTREAVTQSEENLKVSKDRYREGVGTNTEVLDAETLRTKSYSNYYNAVYDAVLATIRLKYVTGEL